MASQRRRRKGEGSLYQRKSDGKWVGAVTVGKDERGRPRRKTVYGDTAKEAQAKKVAVLHDRDRGVPVQTGRLNVETFLNNWLKDVVEPSVRQKTFRTYSDIARLHLVPGLGKKQLSKLSPQDVQKFLRERLGHGLSARTVRHLNDTLRAALNVGAAWGVVSRNAAALARPPRVEKKEMKVFTAEQANTFLDFTRDHRLGALFRLALTLGLRRGELLGLRWSSDIDLDAGVLRVTHALQRVSGDLELTELKTETSRRTFNLSEAPMLLAALRAHRTRQLEERLALGSKWQDIGTVFCSKVGTPMELRNLNRAFSALIERANESLEESARLPKITLHATRHSCATLLLSQGVPPHTISKLLGHSQISLTLDTYAHVIPAMTQGAVGVADAMLRGK